jgi:hypothetical protein
MKMDELSSKDASGRFSVFEFVNMKDLIAFPKGGD